MRNSTQPASGLKPAPQKNAAAFYDLDRTLCATNPVHAYAFFAQRQPSLLRSAIKSTSMLLALPTLLAADTLSRTLFNEVFYRRYAGESHDRLHLLATELFEAVIRPSIYAETYHLIEQSKAAGYRQVLVTGALDILAEPVAQHLGMDAYVANELEFANGYCTGKVKQPIMAGTAKAAWIRSYAEQQGLDLRECRAYSDAISDRPMLEAVGLPTAVNPDRRLAKHAKAQGWPVCYFTPPR